MVGDLGLHCQLEIQPLGPSDPLSRRLAHPDPDCPLHVLRLHRSTLT